MSNQKIYLVTYGSGKYNNTKYRLKQEAIDSGFFDEIFVYGAEDIDSGFLEKYKNLFDGKIEGGNRGGGFWIYKYYFVEKVLKMINENDIVFWLDAGCTINKNGKKRFYEYIDILNNSEHCNLSFIMHHLEKYWTTSQIFNYFDISMNSDIANSGQMMATCIGWKKNNCSFNLINLFFKTIDYDYKLISDAYNKIDQNEYFKDNRHDQSIFSILRKLHGAEILNDETASCDGRYKPFGASRKV